MGSGTKIPTPIFIRFVTFSKSLNLLETWVSHLQNGYTDNTYLLGLLWETRELSRIWYKVNIQQRFVTVVVIIKNVRLFSIFLNVNRTSMSQNILKHTSLFASLINFWNHFLEREFLVKAYLILIIYQIFIKMKKKIQASRGKSEKNTFPE